MRLPRVQRREARKRKRAVKRSGRKESQRYRGDSGYGEWEEISFEDVPDILSGQRDRKGGEDVAITRSCE